MDQARHRFFQYLNRRFGRSITSKCYTSDLDIFLNTICEKAPEAVAAADVDAFIDSQLAAGLSPITINRRLATIHTFFEYLASECPDQHWPNPVIWRRHKLKRGSRLPRDVPDDKIAQLFSVITMERDRAIFGLMLGTGLRVAEVACSMEKLHPGGLSSKPVVVMDDSSQHISPDHDACPISFDSGDRCLLADPLMGSGTIVECHTFLQHVVEMSFIQDEDVI